jgi:hypothetical protein
MATQAVILIPAQKGKVPPHLFAPIVGLPYLHRLILSLWRAGISRVCLMVPAAVRPQLEKRLGRVEGSAAGTLEVVSRWQDLEPAAPNHPEDGAILLMTADMLASPAFYAEFSQAPLPAEGLALAVTDCQPGAQPVGGRASAVQVSLERHLVTCLGFSASSGNHCSLGLALFSQSAWREWRSWLLDRSLAEMPDAALEAALFPYLAEQARQNRLMGITIEADTVAPVRSDQDVKNAAVRLIVAAKGSPWGEGYLESSVNRRLAREILLRLSDKATLINPNFITVSDLLLGLVAVAGFLTGNYWASLGAALLLPWVIVLDTLDGLLARLTFQESPQGRLLDLYGDSTLNLLLFLGISVGQYRATGQTLFLVLLIPLTVGYIWCFRLTNPLPDKHLDTVTGLSPLSPKEFHTKPEKMLNEAISRDYFYIIILCALFNALDWFIIATAIGTNLFGLFLIWRQRRQRI